MTTITWDGKTLAADQCVTGDFQSRGQKLFRMGGVMEGFICGVSGAMGDALRLVRKLEEGDVDGCDEHDWEEIPMLLVVPPEGGGDPFEVTPAMVKLPITTPYHAIGSGSGYAIVALRLGKTAEEAIMIAADYDRDTRVWGQPDTLRRQPCQKRKTSGSRPARSKKPAKPRSRSATAKR